MTALVSKAIATILNIILPLAGGILGFAGSRLGAYLYKKRTRKNKVRTALLSEIRAPKQPINELADQNSLDDIKFNYSNIPTDFYDSHSDEIGILSTDEVEIVVKYYSTAKVVESKLSSLADNDDVSDLDTFFNEIVPALKQARDNAESTLNKEKNFLNRFGN